MGECPHCKKEVSMGDICGKGHDVSSFYEKEPEPTGLAVGQELINRDKEIDRLTAENAKLRNYITDCIFLETAKLISMGYARVCGTGKDTRMMEILRIIRSKGEQALKGE